MQQKSNERCYLWEPLTIGGKNMSVTTLLPLNLQLFSDGFDGVDSGEIANPTPDESSMNDYTEPTSNDGAQSEGEGEGIVNQSSFAKRLAAERAKIEQQYQQEYQQKYADYDRYKSIVDSTLQYTNLASLDEYEQSLQEQRLMAEAERNGLDVETQREIFELKRQQQEQQTKLQQYEQEKAKFEFMSFLNDFTKDKDIKADELHDYIVQNEIYNPDIAYKAMRAEKLESELANAKQLAIKEYLEGKRQAPSVEGGGNAGVVKQSPAKTFEEARARALQRLNTIN